MTASKLTAAGSPFSWLTISTVLRSAQTLSCSRAAARKVSAAASSTEAPSLARCRVSLPMDVVLPAPLTPVTMMTVGVNSPMTSGFSSGLSRASCSLLNQRWRSGATTRAMAFGISIGVTSALPIIEPPLLAGDFRGSVAGGVRAEASPMAGAASGAGASTDGGGGAGRNFFLKKLNIE